MLLQARPEAEARDGELASMRRASGLGERLEARTADTEVLPPDLADSCAGVIVGGSPYSVSDPEAAKGDGQRLTDAGRADPVASALPDRFTALTGHKESAPEPPPGSVLLATNDASPVQLYRAGTVLASQFHPEPTTADFARRATIYQRHGYFPPAEFAAVIAALEAATVTAPQRLLRRFVELAAREDR